MASAVKVELGWTNEYGGPKTALCACKDVSARGFRILSSEPIPVRSYVQFRFAPINFRGTASVRNLSHIGIGYEIGLEFSGMEQMELERLNLLAAPSFIK